MELQNKSIDFALQLLCFCHVITMLLPHNLNAIGKRMS